MVVAVGGERGEASVRAGEGGEDVWRDGGDELQYGEVVPCLAAQDARARIVGLAAKRKIKISFCIEGPKNVAIFLHFSRTI